MNKEYSALVLMATYNGEKYIREQIESIEAQTFENWHLLIRDDGSTDGTLSIIKEFQSKDKRIELVTNITDKHGCNRNFFELIQIAKKIKPYDFYFFSDQDDIFVKSKFADMINCAINSGKNEKPLAVYSDLSFINENGDVTSKDLNSAEMTPPYICYLINDDFFGSASMINNESLAFLPNLLSNPNVNNIPWDVFIAQIAVGLGKAIYLNKPLVMHRIHGDNLSGIHKSRLTLLDYFDKLVGVKKRTRLYGEYLSSSLLAIEQIEEVLKVLPSQITLIKQIIQRGGCFGVKHMKELGIKRRNKTKTLDLHLKVFFKFYKKYMF